MNSHDDVRDEVLELIGQDPRVRFIGWQSSDQLTDLLCAADVYLQPGTQSVTMQNSLCCRCPVILDDVPAHKVYHRDNGWLISRNLPLEDILRDAGKADLALMGANSYALACELLDYRKLAARVLQ